MAQLRCGANRLGRRPTPRGRQLDRDGFRGRTTRLARAPEEQKRARKREIGGADTSAEQTRRPWRWRDKRRARRGGRGCGVDVGEWWPVLGCSWSKKLNFETIV